MFVNTLNNMGYQASRLDSFSIEFVEMAASLGAENICCLEIGCAYGAAALAAIERGAKLYCNDLDSRHLDILQAEINPKHADSLSLVPGDFRFVDLPLNFFGAILCSRVLHFFDGAQVEEAVSRMYQLLKPGGKLVLISETPFLGNWTKFYPDYMANKKNRHKWPGLIRNVAEIEDSGRADNLPELMHFFDIDTMARVVFEVGFTIDKLAYINRCGMFPKDILLDGRESVGLVAVKL